MLPAAGYIKLSSESITISVPMTGAIKAGLMLTADAPFFINPRATSARFPFGAFDSREKMLASATGSKDIVIVMISRLFFSLGLPGERLVILFAIANRPFVKPACNRDIGIIWGNDDVTKVLPEGR